MITSKTIAYCHLRPIMYIRYDTVLLKGHHTLTHTTPYLDCRTRTILWLESRRLDCDFDGCLLALQGPEGCWPGQVRCFCSNPYICLMSHLEVGALLTTAVQYWLLVDNETFIWM